MRLIAVSGIQGSGKTSLIKSFIRHFASKGFSSGIIINEDGEAKYDPEFLTAGNIRLEGLYGG